MARRDRFLHPVAALLLASGLGFAALGTPAAGQGVRGELGAEHREFAALVPRMDLSFAPDILAFDLGYQNEVGETCRGTTTTLRPDEGLFLFAERWDEAQCAQFRYGLPVPRGATLLVLDFMADRNVTAPFGLPDTLGNTIGNVTAIRMPQELVFETTDAEGAVSRTRIPYIDERAGSQETRPFTARFPVPEGVTAVDAVWLFEDAGQEGSPMGPGSPGGMQNPRALSATVRDIRFSWQGATLPFSASNATAERIERREGAEVGVIDYNLTVAVPRELLDPIPAGGYRNTAAVRVPIVAGPRLSDIRGPAGPLGSEEFVVVEGQGRTEVHLPPETLHAYGPGNYTLHYQSVRLVPPPPAPADVERSYPLYAILALLPMVAAVLAIHQAHSYVRQSEGPYRRSAAAVAAAIGLVVAYYVIVLAHSFFRVGPAAMAEVPLSRTALLLYIQFILLLIMLSAAALAVSRTLIRGMRHDLAERARKEDQLRRSNEELERFAYVASHDLQEPLRKVAGFTALLQKKYGGRLDQDADEIIGYAVDGATRMQMLIKDILAYSRVGSKELSRVAVDTNALMQTVAGDLGEPIRESRARVTWDRLPVVEADASQLRQVLQNLVENAIKYRHPRRRPRVHVAGKATPEGWTLSVRDNGMGIPADKHEEIFGIFRRLHGQDHPGTGIGLAVAKKAMERHGGRIWVESKAGQGATFHLHLPRAGRDGTWAPAEAARTARGAAPA